MDDNQSLLDRQSEWQRRRVCLSWAEKIRMVESVQEALRRFRSLAHGQSQQGQGTRGVTRQPQRLQEL
jgi:hypothetical protein